MPWTSKAARLAAERTRRDAEERSERLRGEGREAKAQAEAELESARRLSAEADSLRGTVQRELEQVRRMREDLRREPRPPIQPSRRKATSPSEPEAQPLPPVEAAAAVPVAPLELPVEVSDLPVAPEPPPEPLAIPSSLEASEVPAADAMEVAPIDPQPRPATPNASPVEDASQGERVADLEQALQYLGMDSNLSDDQPGDHAHDHEGEHDLIPSQPVSAPEAPARPVAASEVPTYAELAKALEGLELPGATGAESDPLSLMETPGGTAPPAPQPGHADAAGQDDALGVSGLDQELAAILENVPLSLSDAEPASGGESGPSGDAPFGGSFSGQFHVAVKPLLGSGSLGRFWTALEKAVGLGNILATAPLPDRSGIDFTVDVGRDKVSLDQIVGSLPQADVAVEAPDRVAVTLPDYW